MNARSKSVFVFSDLKMAECKRCLKVVGTVFLMIKNGPGLMVSHMHSLFNRSEEHTSELQSHYSISYAVFCLKKVSMLGCDAHIISNMLLNLFAISYVNPMPTYLPHYIKERVHV